MMTLLFLTGLVATISMLLAVVADEGLGITRRA